MAQTSWFHRYLLPGFVFQSVVIAGGYGTGRELAEFFLTRGPVGGLLAMLLVSTVIWSGVAAVSFELARMHGTFDYRRFLQHLLGPGWIIYELCYFVLLLIVLAVIAAAAGTILEESFGLPYLLGVLGVLVAVGFLTFRGSGIIERFLAGWSFVLYGVYIVLVVWCFNRFGGDIVANLRASSADSDWIVAGVEYAAYNLALIPVLLFSVRHATSRRDALTAGMLAGPIAMIPAFLFYLAMVGQYPHIVDVAVPANFLLDTLGSRGFQLVFQIVLFGTLIETGTGMIHGVNERIAARFRERGKELPASARPVVAIALLTAGALVAQVGLVGLIARGYGTLTWAFVVVFVVPALTWGVWKIVRTPAVSPQPETGS